MKISAPAASILLAVAGLIAALPGQANSVYWKLNDVAFSDGGVASGTFFYDAGTNVYSGVNISTTLGSVMAANTYTNPVNGWDSALVLNNGGSWLALVFGSALTDAGTAVAVLAAAEFELANDSFVDWRIARSGSLVDPPPPSSVPEPGTLVLVGIGLVSIAVARRRLQLMARSPAR
jgi:hypothetical protein